MKRRSWLEHWLLPGAAVFTVAASRWLIHRVSAGEDHEHALQESTADQFAFIVSAVIILGAVALVGRLYHSRWAALWGAVIAALAANSYSIAADWLEVGWGGLVGHDVWFGDHGYWVVTIWRALLAAVIFGVVVVATWGIGRGAQTHQAG